MSEQMGVILGGLLGITNSIICITYLGPTFDSKPALEVKDWRRKFILFFAWLNVVYYLITVFSIRNVIDMEHVLPLALGIMSQVVIIVYLGPTFNHAEKIDNDDWRRKFALFFAWLSVAMVGLSILPLLVSLTTYAGLKSSEYSQLLYK